MRKALFFCVVFSFVAVGCGGTPPERLQGRTMAEVDGEPITEAMFLKEVESLPPYVRPMLETPTGQAQFLENVIDRDLLLREALRRGIELRPDVADRIAKRRKSIILEALLRDTAEKAPGLSDEALRKRYDADPERFRTGERVKVSHMLFREKARAEEMLRRARAGEPFDELMKETALHDGEVAADLGYIERGHFVKEFEAAVFAAAPGSVVGPVKTRYGYHVIKVYGKKPAGIRSFEEVKPQLVEEQREQAQREAFESLIRDLRKRSNIRILVKPGAGAPRDDAAVSLAPPAPAGGVEPAPASPKGR